MRKLSRPKLAGRESCGSLRLARRVVLPVGTDLPDHCGPSVGPAVRDCSGRVAPDQAGFLFLQRWHWAVASSPIRALPAIPRRRACCRKTRVSGWLQASKGAAPGQVNRHSIRIRRAAADSHIDSRDGSVAELQKAGSSVGAMPDVHAFREALRHAGKGAQRQRTPTAARDPACEAGTSPTLQHAGRRAQPALLD